jgi:arginyl-tRNA synthetase
MADDPLRELRAAIQSAVGSTSGQASQAASIERPKRTEQGDYSTNAAMLLAPVLGQPPREIAEGIAEHLRALLGPKMTRADVAGPGFLNLYLSDFWHRDGVAAILDADRFGAAPPATPNILLEFVSANPTGPLTAAGGRGAAYGDSLARVLERAGHSVSREYYLNDAGTQIRTFAASIAARMTGSEPPEGGYEGDYVGGLAEELSSAGIQADDLDRLAQEGTEAMRKRIESTLERFRVRFDDWSSERALHDSNAFEATLDSLRDGGHTYESEGALWLRTSDWGDDKDRVLIRSDGEPTYFATDIAYHRDKLERGAEQMIVPLGADHHGYVPRMKAAVGMLSGDPDRYEAPILQLVNVVENGTRAQMSKRKGEFVSLDELIDDIGTDAARFFLLQRSNDTVIDLDLELARSQSQENPVYYVQYAHARIVSILAKAARESGATNEHDIASAAAESHSMDAPCEPSERALLRRLLELPDEVTAAAEKRAPHRLTAYATAVAADFHVFYRDCRVVGADAESGVAGLESARLGLCLAARRVIAESLDMLGISAPERM